MKIIKISVSVLVLSSSLKGYCQFDCLNNQAIHFSITTENNDIDFIVVDTVLNETKPSFL